jgi:hypothetical protein
MHRVRQSLPYLRENGWEAVVLAVEPRWCDQPEDPLLLETIPSDTKVIRTKAFSSKLTRYIGLGNLEVRAYPFFKHAGEKLLGSEHFDLVYFSTTAFGLIRLGPEWKDRFGVPFVVDMQDPWVNDYYGQPGAPSPPGGRLKYSLMQTFARRDEAKVMRAVSHIISVSPAYTTMLMSRYGWLTPDMFTVLPFGAQEADFELLTRRDIRQTHFDAADGLEHWVYVGRAGADMAFALGAFFEALAAARAKNPSRWAKLRVHFIGTSYAAGTRARQSVMPVAQQHGVADLISELPHRVPYFQGLRCLSDATALVVPGSDDPGYTASKIYPYILAQRPLLGIFHEESSVANVLRETRAGKLVTFGPDELREAVSDKILDLWFSESADQAGPTRWDAFARYTAASMTRVQCGVFDLSAQRT